MSRFFTGRSTVPVLAGVFLICFILCLGPAPLSARERSAPSSGTEGLEDIIEGFDEDAPAVTSGTGAADKPSFWDLKGSVKLGSSYAVHSHAAQGTSTDYGGLTSLRLETDLELDVKLSSSWKARISGWAFHDFAYGINGRDAYTEQVLDEYENESELKDTYLQGSILPSLDFKGGRQIVVWGKSDNLRVTDVLNPLDNREPGLVDIEDLRLPVTMTRLDYYLGKWNLTGIAVHEIRFNKNPVYGNDFYPSPSPSPAETIPGHGGSNTEYAVALNGILTGWDISFYGARIFDDQPHVAPSMELRHSRLTMAGAAVNIALGNWLLKSEAAYFDGLEFFAPVEKKSRTDVLIGTEYAGFSEATLSLEIVNRHIHDFEAVMENPPDGAQENTVQTALRYQQDFMNDTVHVIALALTSGWKGDDGAVQRLSLGYDVNDSVSVTGGYVNYTAGDKAEFSNIGKNDRFFFDVKYSF